jgi:acetylornithine deacetylase
VVQAGRVHSAVADALDLVTPERLVGLLRELLAVPSVTGSAAESEAQHRLEPLLRSAGLETDLWSVDLEITREPDFPGTEVERLEAWGLVGSAGGDDGPVLVLNGHIDVVPVGDRSAWSVDPWGGEVRDGRVLGRGACDMKGGLACQVAAVHVLHEAGARLRGGLRLWSVVGEEDGGLGTYATLRRGHSGDLAVIAEPTAGRLVTACAGALTFRLTVPGRSAHGSVAYEGEDAVARFWPVFAALRELEAERNAQRHPVMEGYAVPYPIAIGIVRAGDWASTVPDQLVAEGRLGVALDEDVADARADLERCVADVCAKDPWLADNPVRVEWPGGQFAPGTMPADSPLASLVGSAVEAVRGERPEVIGAPYGSDLRLLTGAGIPALLYGPGDVRDAHSPDESVPVADLVDVTQALVLLTADICGLA